MAAELKLSKVYSLLVIILLFINNINEIIDLQRSAANKKSFALVPDVLNFIVGT